MSDTRSEEPVVGRAVGRYLMLEAIGRGGCGQVFSAFDPRLERKLAVKLLHRHSLTDAEIVQEGRTLARFSHPNVLPVFDVGVQDGQAYLVMEYVAGGDLRRWFDEGAPQDALEALEGVAMGLAAAHEAGIVHGDVKPANVLIGADGRLRISDFGIARPSTATASDDTDPQVAGTPAYMAPEQALGGATEASDQYAFCLMATEVLAGVRVPARVSAALRRGLAEFPEDRWPSMRVLAQRLRPRAPLRPVLIAGGGMFVLAAALAGGTTEADRCAEASAAARSTWSDRDRAAVQATLRGSDVPEVDRVYQRVSKTLDVYVDDLGDLREKTCRADGQPVEERNARSVCLDRAQYHVAAVIRLLRESVDRADRLVEGLPSLAHCLDPDPGLPPDEIAGDVAALDDELTQVDVLRLAGRVAAADEQLDVIEESVAALEYGRLTARAMLTRARLDGATDRDEQAAQNMRKVLSMSIEMGHRRLAFESATRLGFVLASRLGKLDEGLVFADLGLDYALGLGADPADEAVARGNLAAALSAQGNVEGALVQMRRVLELHIQAYGPRDPRVATSHADLGIDLRQMGLLDEAEQHARAALDIRRSVLGQAHPATARIHVNLATLLAQSGKLEESEALALSVVDMLETSPWATAFDRMMALMALAHAYSQQARHEEAVAVYGEVLALVEPDRRRHESVRVVAIRNLGTALGAQGDLAASERAYADAITAAEAFRGPDHPQTADTRIDRASVLVELDRLDEARAEAEHALRVLDGADGVSPPLLSRAACSVGEIAQVRGDVGEARAQFERCIELREGDQEGLAEAEALLASLD